jgi:hypothetical protein
MMKDIMPMNNKWTSLVEGFLAVNCSKALVHAVRAHVGLSFRLTISFRTLLQCPAKPGEGFVEQRWLNGGSMANVITHRRVRIVALGPEEDLTQHCRAGDIALAERSDGWGMHFVGAAGQVDSYDEPYATYNEALWAAKAAAEYGIE